MIVAYSRGDGAATNYEIAWVTVALAAPEGRGRFLSPDKSRAPIVADPMVRQAQPGYVAAPASLLAFGAWQSGNGSLAKEQADKA